MDTKARIRRGAVGGLQEVSDSISRAMRAKRALSVKDRLTHPRRRLDLGGNQAWTTRAKLGSASGSERFSHPRMVKPPIRYDREWHRVSHPKFPHADNVLTRTQQRRLQRLRREAYGYRYGQETKTEYRPKRRLEKLADEQGTKSMSGDTAPSAASGYSDRQDKQFDVRMVYVLPAQFRAKQIRQPEQDQGPGAKALSPAGNNPTERTSDFLVTERIQVLGPETPSDTVTLTRPPINMLNHVRPLYVRATLDGVPMSRVLVDNGAAINILQLATMKKLGKDSHDLVPTDVLVSSFVGDITTTRGILPLNVGVGR